MKRIVRNKTTRAFLSTDGKWVNDFRFAEDFMNAEAALTAVRKIAVKDVELVLVIGAKPSDYDVALSLFPGSGT